MAGQLWATDSLGGYFYAENLSEKLRTAVQPEVRFRQFCDVKDASQQGKKRGDTFHWDVVGNVSTQGAVLVETSTMPETSFPITQGTLTITEAGNSVPYTGKLEALSMFAVREPIMKALRNDTSKTLDTLAYTEFAKTKLRYVATTATDTGTLYTNGTATGTNTIAFGKGHAKDIHDKMRERNIPSYTGNDYVAIGWTSTFRTLRNDLEDVFKYTPEGFGMIMNGEIGRYENVRYITQTNIAKSGWGQLKSDWIYFCGEDTVAEAIAVPEEIRAKMPTDFGRSKGVAWYYLGGFGLVHTEATESRIVKWDSLA